MIYYAHTREDSDGNRLPESDWQPLSDHLRNVANLAAEFVRPLGLEEEARLSGLLHDLGKYGKRFQDRLHDHRIHGINHWAAGAVQSIGLIPYAVDGHHTGLPAFGALRDTLMRAKQTEHWRELTGCSESLAELLTRFIADGLSLPEPPPKSPSDHFANALRTRLMFSCLVDADFLDTERHFDPVALEHRAVPALDAERALTLVLADVTIKISIKVGGVTFDDGTLEKILTAADLNALGEAPVRFIRAPGVQTSTCHRLFAYQGAALVGQR